MPGAEDDHVTKPVIFNCTPPFHTPVATSCCWVPGVRVGFAGAREMESNPVRLPVPDKLTVCWMVLALSVMVRLPVRVPRLLGVNVREIVQLLPAAKVLGDNGQVDVCAKSPELLIPDIESGTVWLFVTVTLFAALIEPNS